MNDHGRGLPARIGIAALNLLAPGLGLLRVQRLRAALPFLLWPSRSSHPAMFSSWVTIATAAPTAACRAEIGLEQVPVDDIAGVARSGPVSTTDSCGRIALAPFPGTRDRP